jgi:hypothetical protein
VNGQLMIHLTLDAITQAGPVPGCEGISLLHLIEFIPTINVTALLNVIIEHCTPYITHII